METRLIRSLGLRLKLACLESKPLVVLFTHKCEQFIQRLALVTGRLLHRHFLQILETDESFITEKPINPNRGFMDT